MQKSTLTDVVGKDAALLSMVETGVGSLLHALHVPLKGQLLSLNQVFLLTRTVHLNKEIEGIRRAPIQISNVAAILKTLAPAGNKLTPMLAISVQGFLYSTGLFIFGINTLGMIVGAVLSSLWAMAQPLLLYYVLFGDTLIKVTEHWLKVLREIWPVTPDQIWIGLFALIGLKSLIAAAVVVYARKMPESAANRYLTMLVLRSKVVLRTRKNRIPKKTTPFKGALKDISNPIFIISIALTAVFLFFSETSASQIVWTLLRPVAIGLVIFYLIRRLDFENFLRKLEVKGLTSQAKALRVALDAINDL